MNTSITTTIDIKDRFGLTDIRDKKNYDVDGDEIINDLKRCFIVFDSTPEEFMIKDYDAVNEFVKISYTNEAIVKGKLKKIVIGFNQGKSVSTWDIYLQHTKLFTVKALNSKSSHGARYSLKVWLKGHLARSYIITNIDDIVGKSNASLENKKIIVVNILKCVDMNKQLNSEPVI